jgi:hypothetical protein
VSRGSERNNREPSIRRDTRDFRSEALSLDSGSRKRSRTDGSEKPEEGEWDEGDRRTARGRSNSIDREDNGREHNGADVHSETYEPPVNTADSTILQLEDEEEDNDAKNSSSAGRLRR